MGININSPIRAPWRRGRKINTFIYENLILTNKRNYSTNNSDRREKLSKVVIKFLKEKNLMPVFIYEDLHLDSTKNKVLSDTKNLSGIYLILNKITLDYYVGSAFTGRLYIRFTNHMFNFSGNKLVKSAVKKYSLSEFAFFVLELFPEKVNKENNKKLLDLEDFYLKSLLPNYNILTEAGSSFGYKHSDITRLKMKSNYSLERRMQIGNLNKGKNLKAETIKLLKDKALTRKKPVLSEQGKLNMKKKSKPVIIYNLDLTIFGQFSSITKAAKYVNCNEKTIRRALKTDKNLLKKR